MAKWSSDWSLIPIIAPKTFSKALLSISSPLAILSISPSSSFGCRKLIIVNSAKPSSSPLLEDSSNGLQIIQLSHSPTAEEQFPCSDLVLSNEFIRGLCKDPQTQLLAFDYYQKAKLQPNFRPDPSTLDFLVTGLIELKQWSSISTLSKDFKALDLYPSRSTCASLISSCILERKFKLAESLLGVLGTKKVTAVLAYGSAMRGYNKLHMYSSTVLAFDRMRAANLSPNAGCYLLIMNAYRKLGDTDKVLSLFLEFESRHFDSSPLSVEIYFVLCDSLGRSGEAFKALGYFREMTGKGLSPNPSIYASLIVSFAGIKEAEIAEDLLQEAKEKRMVKDPAAFLKLVLMYVELGLVEKTLGLVEVMKEMGIKVSDCVLCAVVNGYASKRGLRASLRAYEQLKCMDCEFGQVTYASIINVYCRLGLSHKAETVFAEMMEKGFDKCVVAYSNMISMYGKGGKARDAVRLLAKMKENRCEPNVWVYNSLLNMHGRLKNMKQVEKLWKEMKRREIAPDKISYTSMVSAYSKAREFEECLKLYQEFRRRGGKVDRILAGIMVGVFSKSNRIDELIKLLQDLKSEGIGLDVKLYKSSLNALRDAGLQSRVEWLEQNFRIDQDKKNLIPAGSWMSSN